MVIYICLKLSSSMVSSPSCGSQRSLNFEVMAVRDIKLSSRLSKNIHFSRDF